MCSSSLPPKVWQLTRESSAVTSDEDDAERCRSDAQARPSAAFVAAERVGGTIDLGGADIALDVARESYKIFWNVRHCSSRNGSLRERTFAFRVSFGLSCALGVPALRKPISCVGGALYICMLPSHLASRRPLQARGHTHGQVYRRTTSVVTDTDLKPY